MKKTLIAAMAICTGLSMMSAHAAITVDGAFNNGAALSVDGVVNGTGVLDVAGDAWLQLILVPDGQPGGPGEFTAGVPGPGGTVGAGEVLVYETSALTANPAFGTPGSFGEYLFTGSDIPLGGKVEFTAPPPDGHGLFVRVFAAPTAGAIAPGTLYWDGELASAADRPGALPTQAIGVFPSRPGQFVGQTGVVVPEPSVVALLGLGLAGLALRRRNAR